MAKKQRAGGKLNRSVSVQVRFDPRLKMAAELAASRERRSLSSFVEWATEQACKLVQVTKAADGTPVTAWDVAEQGWSLAPLPRLRFMEVNYPELLTTRERGLLEAVHFARRTVSDQEEGAELLREILCIHCWELLSRYADEDIDGVQLWQGLQRMRRGMTRSPNGQWGFEMIDWSGWTGESDAP